MAEKSSHFLSGKRIIVAGSSIAGLTFISTLDQLFPPSLPRPSITVLERSTREDILTKDPYTFSLHGSKADEGLIALQQLSLLDSIRSHATLNSGAIWVWADNWKLLASINPQPWGDLPAATMRITRADLKRVLLEKAEKAEKCTWQWCCTVERAERLPNGQIRVTISNSNSNNTSPSTPSTLTQDCDLLIAADGADSRIRASLRPQDMKFQYAGAMQIGGTSHFRDGVPRPVNVDYGLQMSSGEGICCIYTPFDKNTIGWALSKMESERAGKNSFTEEEFVKLKEEALKTGSVGKFGEPFKSIVEATDSTTAFIRPAKEKAPFHHDANLRGVVFIGDANHVLNCFTLDGANLALKDGWDLAEQICRNGSMEEAVKGYDERDVARAQAVIKWSHERIRFGHSTGLMWKVYKYGMAAQRMMKKK